METWCGGEAGVAQLVEQLTCNQQVGGSIPFASSLRRHDTEPRRETSAPVRRPAEGKKSQKHLASRLWNAEPARRHASGKSKGATTSEPRRGKAAPAFGPASFEGRYPSGQREQTVNLSASAFGGSNPPLPTQPREAGCATQGRFQGPRLRWFWFGECTVKSVSLLGPGGQGLRGATQARLRGNSSVGRAPAFQAGGRGFEPRFPLLRSWPRW